MIKRLAVPVLSVLATLAASPALASFHFMKIEQVIGGVGGDTAQQAIQIRMRGAGQNQLSGQARLVVRDAAGMNPITLIAFSGANPPLSQQGRRVLIVSAAFAAAQTGITADYTMTNTIPASYLAAGRLTFEGVLPPPDGDLLWSLAWGGAGYTGSHIGSTTNDSNGDFGPAFGAALPSGGAQALLFSAPDATGGAGSTTNLADYSVTAGAATFTNNAGVSGVVVAPPQADLSLVKSDAPDPAPVLQPLIYTLAVTNLGPAAATAVEVTDTLPPLAAFVSATGDGWTCGEAGGVVTCTRPALAVEAAPLITLTVTAPAAPTTLTNTASVTAAEADPVSANNSDSEDTTVSLPPGQTSFYALTPCRVADTRGAEGPALQAGSTRDFDVAGRCNVPADAQAVAITLTVVQETADGNLRLFPAGAPVPTASTINFRAGRVRANNAIVGLSAGGDISVRCDLAGGTGSTHFLFDVLGYFR